MGAWIFKAFLLQLPKIEAHPLGSFLYLHVYKSSHFPCLLASLLQIKQTNGLLHPFFWMHINKGPCRNINDKPTSKKDEVTFLKDAAQAWGQLYKGQHSKRVTWYVLVTKIVQDKSRHYIKQVEAAGLASRESFGTWLEVMTGFINAYQWSRKYDQVLPLTNLWVLGCNPTK